LKSQIQDAMLARANPDVTVKLAEEFDTIRGEKREN
jgi:hypothetical protein